MFQLLGFVVVFVKCFNYWVGNVLVKAKPGALLHVFRKCFVNGFVVVFVKCFVTVLVSVVVNIGKSILEFRR